MGTVVNSAAIILGGLIGMLIRRGLPEKVESMSMKMLGLSVFVVGVNGVVTSMVTVGAQGALESNGSLLLIASLVIGGVLGECMNIDDHLNSAGRRVEEKFGKDGFAKGFINGSLIFCIGALAIVGSINDGLAGDSSILFIKSALDFVCSIILGSTLGFGVIFSFIPVLIYQGAITLAAVWIAPYISTELLNSICMVGYAIVMTIGINFLEFTKIKTANLLPAIFVPIIYSFIEPLLAQIMTVFS
ncbi:DUF554 domain-containing protein [Youxingia wuxianensis]|uniref:DUF554 domain-containing protein n=1 Tax=Youxingia wuxianensis TaxID=2763678 RepID=A0A926IGT1_9FIRM|nr:DUF554 domain-containing protein [Youxingia wuxianensis]MBC8584581.1 DUF554 domain-containing protein [Youxingia wuxianensis]